METESPMHQESEHIYAENNVEKDEEDIVTNNIENGSDKFVSDNEHVYAENNVEQDVEDILSNNLEDDVGQPVSDNGNVETSYVEVPITLINNKKKKCDKKSKKKINKKNDTLKPRNTPTKMVTTPKANKKGEIGKNKKEVTGNSKPTVKKKETPKRKVGIVVQVTKGNIDGFVEDIVVLPVKKSRNIIGGKKISYDIPLAPTDNVSFHSYESVMKWKYVFQRRITYVRLSEEVM